MHLQQEGEEEKHGQNGKIFFCYNFAQNIYFSERFGTQLIFDMYCAVNSKKLEIESKNCISKCMGTCYKYHSNPYIQGTTVPCDTLTIIVHNMFILPILTHPLILI